MMQECPICWRKLNPRRHRRYGLTCSHYYHEKCLQNWHDQGHEGCPICDPPAPPEPEEGPKPCPHCGIEIIKVGGCDHMICAACGRAFWWNRRLEPEPEKPALGIWFAIVVLIGIGVVIWERADVEKQCDQLNCLKQDLVPRSVLQQRWEELQAQKEALEQDERRLYLQVKVLQNRRHFVSSSLDYFVIMIVTLFLNGEMCMTPGYSWSSRLFVHGSTIVLLPILYYA